MTEIEIEVELEIKIKIEVEVGIGGLRVLDYLSLEFEIRLSAVWYDLMWFCTVRLRVVLYVIVRCGVVLCGMV